LISIFKKITKYSLRIPKKFQLYLRILCFFVRNIYFSNKALKLDINQTNYAMLLRVYSVAWFNSHLGQRTEDNGTTGIFWAESTPAPSTPQAKSCQPPPPLLFTLGSVVD
jgi:hypothetical protein